MVLIGLGVVNNHLKSEHSFYSTRADVNKRDLYKLTPLHHAALR